MKTGFIGAGKASFTLGKHFQLNGAYVNGYYSRTYESAKQAAEFTGTKCYKELDDIVRESDLLFLTVPDGMIGVVWDAVKVLPLEGKIICHCSGLLSSDIFGGIRQKGAYGYSVHPLFAISSRTESYTEIPKAVFTIEGDVRRLDFLMRFIGQMGNEVYSITAAQKIKYHAAAVFLSNLVTALAYTGVGLLKDCGFDERFCETALRTLFLNQCGVIAEKGPIEALTGPIERNDLATVKKHMDCLNEPEQGLYRFLSLELIKMAKLKHNKTDSGDYNEMEKYMQNGMELV